MKNIITRIICLSLLSVALIQCNNNSIKNTIKLYPSDPFINTIVPSETFEIDSKQDNVIEGNNGTIVVCPIGCFKNANGEIVEDNVEIELSEALTLDDMLLSNLTTTSNGKPLVTDGMIYFNATSNGEQLTINKENPIHIEIPTTEKKMGMMVYKGIRDENGNMNWVEPKELDNYLLTVDINSLDFLPPGFQTEVDKGMPFKNHQSATQNLTDSLYYSLSATERILLPEQSPATVNEPYYNDNKQVVKGKYSSNSFLSNSKDTAKETSDSSSAKSNCGIDPAIIKVIKSEKYQNTLIATKEFEARLKVIFKTCDNSVLEIYIKNLDKNLYELDSLAAELCDAKKYYECYHALIEFSHQRLTKVREADKYANLLKDYFDEQLTKVKSELEKGQEKVLKELNAKNEQAQKVVEDYKKLLWKREKYRMETYGFNWTETGWINIDNGTLPKEWDGQPLEIIVENSKQFDRVYTYVVYTSIKSLYRLNTTDNEKFYVGNAEDKNMLMPKNKLSVAIAIGYKDDAPSISIREFKTGSEQKFSLTLSPSSIDKVKEAISQYEKCAKENQISIDLEFMAKFYKEEQRQNALKKENEFILQLWNIAYPCCDDKVLGEKLFFRNCSSCHFQDTSKFIGPGLAYSTTHHSENWLYQWTTNSSALIKSGDKEANKLFNDYNKLMQQNFNLTKEEVSAIYRYIDNYNSNLK